MLNKTIPRKSPMTNKERLNALDLFSGIAGNTLALREYIRTIAYCEFDRHAQATLLSRMSDGSIEPAPICSDVTKLDGSELKGLVDIIIAGFPCQDISVAGKGAGLSGERSGLFFQVMRLAKEIKPTFIFLENVPAIRTRGLDTVIQELTALGYDCRWTMLSAASVGAPHKRERWFCLAHARDEQSQKHEGNDALDKQRSTDGRREQFTSRTGTSSGIESWNNTERTEANTSFSESADLPNQVSDINSQRLEVEQEDGQLTDRESSTSSRSWWAVEPDVGRVVNGLPLRVDRIKRLGNAVVPQQAREAFKLLMGIR